MQLLPVAVEDVGGSWSSVIKDWRANLYLGAKYLKVCRERTHSWQEAIVAYNWGIAHVEEFRRGVVASETQAYLENVFR
jgi:soluble lytic murein transglycosylase-like protein